MGAERLQDIIEIYRFNETSTTFSSSCVLIFNRDGVYIKGLYGKIGLEDARTLREYLRDCGVKEVRYERRKGRGTLDKEFDIEKGL